MKSIVQLFLLILLNSSQLLACSSNDTEAYFLGASKDTIYFKEQFDYEKYHITKIFRTKSKLDSVSILCDPYGDVAKCDSIEALLPVQSKRFGDFRQSAGIELKSIYFPGKAPDSSASAENKKGAIAARFQLFLSKPGNPKLYFLAEWKENPYFIYPWNRWNGPNLRQVLDWGYFPKQKILVAKNNSRPYSTIDCHVNIEMHYSRFALPTEFLNEKFERQAWAGDSLVFAQWQKKITNVSKYKLSDLSSDLYEIYYRIYQQYSPAKDIPIWGRRQFKYYWNEQSRIFEVYLSAIDRFEMILLYSQKIPEEKGEPRLHTVMPLAKKDQFELEIVYKQGQKLTSESIKIALLDLAVFKGKKHQDWLIQWELSILRNQLGRDINKEFWSYED